MMRSKSASSYDLGRSERHHALRIDQDVGDADLGLDAGDERVERRRVGDVGGECARGDAAGAESRHSVASSLSARRPTTCTSAPASARPSAIARPMPLPPPITRARRCRREKGESAMPRSSKRRRQSRASFSPRRRRAPIACRTTPCAGLSAGPRGPGIGPSGRCVGLARALGAGLAGAADRLALPGGARLRCRADAPCSPEGFVAPRLARKAATRSITCALGMVRGSARARRRSAGRRSSRSRRRGSAASPRRRTASGRSGRRDLLDEPDGQLELGVADLDQVDAELVDGAHLVGIEKLLQDEAALGRADLTMYCLERQAHFARAQRPLSRIALQQQRVRLPAALVRGQEVGLVVVDGVDRVPRE